ncbi:MAG: ribbon-helix-helix protein, CopG family [Planctomycetes bacterium]|nr:ribbon-helix-helix protein, CopG family [Planctomycetota bacterium]
MKTISLKLPSGLSARLDRAAKRRGQTKSEIVRSALEQYLNGEHAVPPGSMLEAALPWIGCVEGPGDLSTNPKYMEGFGK